MIICFFIEVTDEAHQVRVEHAMQAPFIDAGKVSDMKLEEFETCFGPHSYGTSFEVEPC